MTPALVFGYIGLGAVLGYLGGYVVASREADARYEKLWKSRDEWVALADKWRALATSYVRR